jgi:enterochelin esterase-like enzyme
MVMGWLPAALTVLGSLALAALIVLPWRRSWWLRAIVVIAATGIFAIAVDLFITNVWRPFPDAIPLSVLLWGWLGLCGLALAIAHIVRNPRRMVAVVAGLTALAGIGMVQVNRYYGQYPTLGTALGRTRPELTSLSTVDDAYDLLTAPDGSYLSDVWPRGSRVPAKGIVSRIDIPPTASGFRARPAYVYLPPAYLHTNPRPALPVLVLLAGQPGNADSWLVSGQLAKRMDAYAGRHAGLAPIVVMPDNLGASFTNPLCVDSKRGKVETYLAVDVPAWIRSHLQAAEQREMWAIAGLSSGGTCSLQLAVRKPERYGRFLDISGEAQPLEGTKAQTISALFGDAAAYAAINPVDIMARKGFPQTAGRVVVGTSDPSRPELPRLLEDCRRAGMDMSFAELPGEHTWRVWAPALETSLDWLSAKTRLVRGSGWTGT